jgi:Sulfatase-modifying factor enzyme 1
MRWLLVALPVIVVFAACAAERPPAAPPTPPAPPVAPPADAGAPPSDASAPPSDAGAVDAAASATAPAPPKPNACPAGMVLIDGDYCTKVEQKCQQSWWGKSNKKKICERFQKPTVCIGKKVHKRYCIDRYEYPDIKDARPEVMNNFYQAQVKCAALGKRVCTESEWNLACEGPEMKPYPYGYARDATKCNGDHTYDFPNMKKVAARDPKELERLWLGVPSGTQPECVSDYGVADMPGNADELAASEHDNGTWKDKYDNVTTGGPWFEGVRNQCRPKIYTHNEGFYYYYLSFRCCAEADGKPTDPRAPKQIKRGWKFSHVERLANLTVAQAKKEQPADFARAERLGEKQIKQLDARPADYKTWHPNMGKNSRWDYQHPLPHKK